MKTYNITKRMSKEAHKAIENAVVVNEKYSHSIFFHPGTTAGTRRGNEERFFEKNPDFSIKNGKDLIKVRFTYSESCKNVYFSLKVSVNDEKKDIRILKNFLK